MYSNAHLIKKKGSIQQDSTRPIHTYIECQGKLGRENEDILCRAVFEETLKLKDKDVIGYSGDLHPETFVYLAILSTDTNKVLFEQSDKLLWAKYYTGNPNVLAMFSVGINNMYDSLIYVNSRIKYGCGYCMFNKIYGTKDIKEFQKKNLNTDD